MQPSSPSSSTDSLFIYSHFLWHRSLASISSHPSPKRYGLAEHGEPSHAHRRHRHRARFVADLRRVLAGARIPTATQLRQSSLSDFNRPELAPLLPASLRLGLSGNPRKLGAVDAVVQV